MKLKKENVTLALAVFSTAAIITTPITAALATAALIVGLLLS